MKWRCYNVTMSMLLLTILSSALIIEAGVVNDDRIEKKSCDGVIIDNVYYEAEVLKSDLDRPFLLAVDNERNILYFSYSLNKEDDLFKTAYVNLNNNEFGEILDNGFAQAVDQKTHYLYIGGSDAVYRYNQKTKRIELYGAEDVNIWSVYFKDVLYYTDFPGQFLYCIMNDGRSERVKDLEDTKVEHFILDNEDTFYYTNATGLYGQKKGTKDAILYQKYPHDGVRGIAMDLNGKVFVCVHNGIYSVEKDTVTLKKILDLDDGFGLAFDKDNNIIYSDATSVYRLKPNNDKACV